MVKVSVVIPVYNPGRFIEPGIESMLRQTLPPGELELIYVDDGSTDDTPARLDALAAEHPHVRVFHEPNSGWAGRPRNVGIREARGDYIQFLDQDDAMTPDALRLIHEMAVRNGSDIVIGKVASNFRPVPQHLFRQNVESCTIRDTSLISSLTPHKLFRTAFLREHGIEFPEGRRRLEDQLFMVRAYLVAQTVSILAETVCYLYARRDDGGNSGSRVIDPVAYFGNLREILEVVVANTEPGAFRTDLLGRFYKTGMLDRLSEPWYLARNEAARQAVFREVRALALDFIDDDVHRGLGTIRRLRSTLLRADQQAGLVTLAKRLRRLDAWTAVDELRWVWPRLEVDLRAGLVLGADRQPFEVVRRNGRAHLPPSLLEGILETPFEIDEEEPWGRLQCFLRERSSGTEWRVPAPVHVDLESLAGDDGEERVRPRYRTTARVNLLKIAGGHPLGPGEWELRVRVFGPGIDRRADLLPAEGRVLLPALIATPDGRVSAAAAPGPDGLVIRVPALAGRDGGAAGGQGDGLELEVPVPVAPDLDASEVEVVARRGAASVRLAGRIRDRGGSATLVVPAGDLTATPGAWQLLAEAPGRDGPPRPVATLQVAGAAAPLATGPAAASPAGAARAGRIVPRLTRWVARHLSTTRRRQIDGFLARWR